MPQSTSTQPQQPTPEAFAPRTNQVLTEPATVAACQADYDDADDIRRRMDRQDGRTDY